MRRLRTPIALALALVALTLLLAACGDDDDDDDGAETTTSAPAAPGLGGSAPSAGALPPGIAECVAAEGYEIEPSELHSVPQAVLAKCFNQLHQGGGP